MIEINFSSGVLQFDVISSFHVFSHSELFSIEYFKLFFTSEWILLVIWPLLLSLVSCKLFSLARFISTFFSFRFFSVFEVSEVSGTEDSRQTADRCLALSEFSKFCPNICPTVRPRRIRRFEEVLRIFRTSRVLRGRLWRRGRHRRGLVLNRWPETETKKELRTKIETKTAI